MDQPSISECPNPALVLLHLVFTQGSNVNVLAVCTNAVASDHVHTS